MEEDGAEDKSKVRQYEERHGKAREDTARRRGAWLGEGAGAALLYTTESL